MLNILIVEDDVTIRELLSYNLKKKFKILEANSASSIFDSSPGAPGWMIGAVFADNWNTNVNRNIIV